MSYASVQAAVAESANVVSDPPEVLDMDLARQHVAALDDLPLDVIRAAKVIHVSGITQAISASACDAMVAALEEAPRAGL